MEWDPPVRRLQLKPGETIELYPGVYFARRVHSKTMTMMALMNMMPKDPYNVWVVNKKSGRTIDEYDNIDDAKKFARIAYNQGLTDLEIILFEN